MLYSFLIFTNSPSIIFLLFCIRFQTLAKILISSRVMAKVCVVLGSVREGRMGERVARMVRRTDITAEY